MLLSVGLLVGSIPESIAAAEVQAMPKPKVMAAKPSVKLLRMSYPSSCSSAKTRSAEMAINSGKLMRLASGF
jgi:hypothetical protein